MLRRIALVAGLLIALPLVAVPCWIATHRSDLASPGDEDLAVATYELPPGGDGFVQLAIAAERLDWPEAAEADARLRAVRSGERAEPAWVARRVARNAAALDALRLALAAPAMRIPDHGLTTTEALLDVLLGAQRLVKLAGADSRARLAAGDRAGAIERATLGLRLGQRLASAGGGDLLSLMLATALQGISLADLEALARRIPFDAEGSRALTARLESLRWTAAAWRSAWAGEYQQLKAALLEVEPGHEALLAGSEEARSTPWLWKLVPEDYLWQPNRTLARLAAQYRERQRRAAGPCRAAQGTLPSEEGRSGRILRAVVLPNPVGSILAEIATPNFERFDRKRCHLETRIGLLQVLIAAKAYWHVEGALPERLDELVPLYLAEIPRDRFDGGELRYSLAARVVASIGEDFSAAAQNPSPEPTDPSEPALSLVF